MFDEIQEILSWSESEIIEKTLRATCPKCTCMDDLKVLSVVEIEDKRT